MRKAPQCRTAFGSWGVKKVHSVLARSTCRSQKCENLTGSGQFWNLRCWKSALCCGAMRVSKSKVLKTDCPGPLLDVQMSFRVTNEGDCAWAKREGFLAFPKTITGVRHLKRICKYAVRGAGAVQETQKADMLGGRRADFLRGCILKHQIFRFPKLILRDMCSTSYDLASLLRGRRSSVDRWSAKFVQRIGKRPPVLHSTFHFWGKSRRIASFFWCCQLQILRGCLAELLRFWCCQAQKLTKPRRTTATTTTTLHYTTPHRFHYTALHYATLHWQQLQLQLQLDNFTLH